MHTLYPEHQKIETFTKLLNLHVFKKGLISRQFIPLVFWHPIIIGVRWCKAWGTSIFCFTFQLILAHMCGSQHTLLVWGRSWKKANSKKKVGVCFSWFFTIQQNFRQFQIVIHYWLIDCIFSNCFTYIGVASASFHAFLEFYFIRTLQNILSKPLAAFPFNYRQNNERQWKTNKYWLSQGIDQGPPVNMSCTLSTELPGQQQIDDFINTIMFLTLSQTTKFLDSSTWKEFADDNFNFNENDRKFSKRVENTVGKGEIACYEQFLFFPQCFQRTWIADTRKQGFVWKRVNTLPHNPDFQQPWNELVL